MASSDSSPQVDPEHSGLIDPVDDRQRRFAILSQEDSLKGPAILLAVGLLLLLGSAAGLGRETGVVEMLTSVALSTAVALPIDLIGLFIVASVLGTGFGTVRAAVVRLSAVIILLQGLSWTLYLGYSASESRYVLVGGVLLISVIGFGLMMDLFDLSIFETFVCLVILGATESAAAALLEWLLASGVIPSGESAEPAVVMCLRLAGQFLS